MEYWMVTLNGHPIRDHMTRRDAEQMAERWQGERYKRGVLKHGDDGEWLEIKPDVRSMLRFNEQYARAKNGQLQEPVQYIGG